MEGLMDIYSPLPEVIPRERAGNWQLEVKIQFELRCRMVEKIIQYFVVGAYPGFCSMTPTRSIAIPPGWNDSPTPGLPSA